MLEQNGSFLRKIEKVDFILVDFFEGIFVGIVVMCEDIQRKVEKI